MNTTAPVVELAQGTARGVWRLGSAAFLGIPFAEAPVGEHRYAAPVPAAGWEGVRECTEYGATAQVKPLAEVTAIPEPSIPGDSVLNVNVFTPAPGQVDAALPVFVWIHGGGYKAGSPASPWYDGFSFNRDGIVTVTISYRLGFDGFGWIPDAPHNRGLLDQIAALTWVRDNIAAFGGDPANVTIGGQSAGGGSVCALLIAPAARGLFHAAISHSGALSPQPAAVARANGEAMARLADVEWSRAGLAGLTNAELLDLTDELEATPPPTSLGDAVARTVAGGGLSLAFAPYVDGEVLTGSVEEALRDGSSDVPLLMGATAHEFTAAGSMFAPLLATGSVPDALAATPLAPVAAEYLAAYADLPGGEATVVGQLMTDTMFRIPMVRWAGLREAAPTWLYDFRWLHTGTGLASHCADLPVSAMASPTELKTGMPSTSWPALPGVTPATTWAPLATIRRVCLVPSEPVMPCTSRRLSEFRKIAIVLLLRLPRPVGPRGARRHPWCRRARSRRARPRRGSGDPRRRCSRRCGTRSAWSRPRPCRPASGSLR